MGGTASIATRPCRHRAHTIASVTRIAILTRHHAAGFRHGRHGPTTDSGRHHVATAATTTVTAPARRSSSLKRRGRARPGSISCECRRNRGFRGCRRISWRRPTSPKRSQRAASPTIGLAEVRLRPSGYAAAEGLQPSLREGLPSRSRRSLRRLVEPGGIEPPTSCMPCKRSPS